MSKKLLKGMIGYAAKKIAGPETRQIVSNRMATLRGVERLLVVANQHKKTFSGFKGIYTGKDVVLVGAGPTAKDFKHIPNWE